MSVTDERNDHDVDAAQADGGWQDKFTSPWARESARLGERWRRQLIPLVAIGGTHGVGAVAASMGGVEAAAAVGAGWAAAGGAYGYAHQKSSGWNRVYAGIAALGSASFQAGLALAGADGVTASLLWACGCALSVPWWVRNSEKDPDVTAELAMPTRERPALPAAPGERVQLWNTHLAANGKALAGSALSAPKDFAYGWKATVQLAITEHWHKTLEARKQILSVYDLPDGRVFVESINGESVRKAQITVLTSDPLQETTHWTGPGLDPSTGSFPLMVAADSQQLHFKFWNPGAGALHALISGVTRSGKTTVLDTVLTEASMSDRVYPVVADGGGGASLPQWKDRVKLFAENPTDARKLLRYVLRLMEQRRTVLKRQGGGSLEPTPDMPLIPVILDEAHNLLMSDSVRGDNKDVVAMCEQIVQEGAKFGISLILATQVPSVKQLGNSIALRDQIKAGTIVGLRITEKGSGNMITTGDPMPEELRDLPPQFPNGKATHGLGYMMTSRKIRARALFLKNPREWPVTETRLDPDCASERVPAMDGVSEEDKEDVRPSGTMTVFDPDEAVDLVMKALDDGISPEDIKTLMESTGLTMGQVRRSLPK